MGEGEWPQQTTTLTFLAGASETLRLGTSAMIVAHRDPLLRAKTLATQDVQSQGLFTQGFGIGCIEGEHPAVSLFWPSCCYICPPPHKGGVPVRHPTPTILM
jgi:alkanesulfonate monooxygenase SsuD/methylene tetrahydromethanopterin reductase-like flavin-dependent oxidoreductase (luciferase family)